MVKFKEALKLFGSQECHYHGFVSTGKEFRLRTKTIRNDDGTYAKVHHPLDPQHFTRKPDIIELRHVDPPYSARFQPAFDLFNFYEIEFQDKGFFRHQVL